MSFLARRVAASEGAFFSQTSKEAIARLREKASRSSSPKCVESASVSSHEEGNADVLPEILQHSLPEQQYDGLLPSPFSPSPSSLAASLSSSGHSSPSSFHRMDTSGPLDFLPTLPQASFGPRRWTPAEEDVKILASTANESRMEGTPTIDDARAKALVDGYAIVMKAFLIATALVVGGAAVVAGVVGSKLQIRSMISLLKVGSTCNLKLKRFVRDLDPGGNGYRKEAGIVTSVIVSGMRLMPFLRKNWVQNHLWRRLKKGDKLVLSFL